MSSLNDLSDKLNLESLAFEGAQNWVSSIEFDGGKSDSRDYKFRFASHKLCFKCESFDYNYIETVLDVIYQGEKIGYYKLVSMLNGEPTDDMLVVTDDEFKNR
jgi:hypothetical protein